jgi:hypothetical protein
MSESTRTPAHLQLVRPSPDTALRAGEDRLHLPPTPRLRKFLAAAASAGLEPTDAVRLALERALALEDACDAFPLDVESARRELRRAGADSQPLRELTSAQAGYVRALSAGRARRVEELNEDLVVALPDRVTTRARGQLTELALHDGVVAEMIAWEIAATLEGRTMGEWALVTLAVARRSA